MTSRARLLGPFAILMAAIAWQAPPACGDDAGAAADSTQVDIDLEEPVSKSAASDAEAAAPKKCDEQCDEKCDEQCADKPCDDKPCDAAADEATVAKQAEPAAPVDFSATHKQSTVIKVNVDDLAKAELKSFCLLPTGDILAACDVDSAGEVRVFSPAGDYRETWSVPVTPEAINVGSDGQVYIAGQGKLLCVSTSGKVITEAESPHAADMMSKKDEIRGSILQQQKRSAERFSSMLGQYQKMLDRAEVKLKALEETLAEHKQQSAEAPASEADAVVAAAEELAEEGSSADESTKPAPSKAELAMLKVRIKQQKRNRDNAARMVKQIEQIVDAEGGAKELSEVEIEKRVKSSMEYKMRVASISEADGQVYVATSAPKGYGFAVWRMNRDFAEADSIVDGLSGCCGQMDVQAGKDGLFVAENSRHRVCRFDENGKLVCEWGSQARTGTRGFGSCCNPMNVAFGPGGSVYTAESGSGRIKRYDAEGNLLGLVGSVEIVPGCKKVSIAVDSSGDRVYMLDITRHHIVMMERVAPDQQLGQQIRDADAAPAAEVEQAAAVETGDTLRVATITSYQVEEQMQTEEPQAKETQPAESESGIQSLFRAIGAAMAE